MQQSGSEAARPPVPGVHTARVYSWALSKDVSAELRITGDSIKKSHAERLRQYVDLTMAALAAEPKPDEK